jgi:hypothetical protein
MYDAALLPVTEQVHLVVISTTAPSPCLDAVSDALTCAGAQLRHFSLRAMGDRFEASLRLTGVDEDGAQRCASIIRAARGVSGVSLEHQLLKP